MYLAAQLEPKTLPFCACNTKLEVGTCSYNVLDNLFDSWWGELYYLPLNLPLNMYNLSMLV